MSAQKRTFTAILLKDKHAGGYVAQCPEVDVVTEGETVEEALTMLEDAVRLTLEAEPDPEIVEYEGLPVVSSIEVSWDAQAPTRQAG